MTELMCNAENCVNNINGLCSANIIEISGERADTSFETKCNTYGYKNFHNTMMNLVNTNYAGEVAQSFTNSKIVLSPKIQCGAIHCKYNSENRCVAENVFVRGNSTKSSEGTQCETFID